MKILGPLAFFAMPFIVASCAPRPAPYYASTYTPSAPAPKLEPGTPVALSAQDKQIVKAGVAKGMKDPESARFGDEMAAAKDGKGTITVCGYVNGKNSYGGYVGMGPFIGVLSREAKVFGLVDIGSSKDRAITAKLCADSGIPGIN